MERLLIRGGRRLRGKISISGAKNAALPIIMASIIAEGRSLLKNIPNLNDINNLIKILDSLGAEAKYEDNTLFVNSDTVNSVVIPYELAGKLRASYYAFGALLSRCGEVSAFLPGGCEIGSRPIDLHLKGFKALGAQVIMDDGMITIKGDRLKGAKIYLDYPSVGATLNIMMAAVRAEGKTFIENAAREPEIIDVANYLNVMGAKIKGAGTDLIRIEGVKKLTGADYTIIPDRIEAGTYMIAGAITRGDILLENVLVEHVKPLISKLKEMGIEVEEDVNSVRIVGKGELKAVDVKTLPYPGFPTDMQAQFMALLTNSKGMSVVVETVFENRFGHVNELKKMGAEIKIDGRTAVIEERNLSGAKVKATDLRAGAALILAALVAEGETEIVDIYHIERGYEDIVDKLKGVGVDIKKVINA